ncbi:MAG: hypothetical protein ACOX4L_01900 [Bacillota bacterium]|jgi:hypothetical protein
MLISTSTVLAMYCPKCGELNFQAVSIFDFSGRRSVQVPCNCGTVMATLSGVNCKKISLQTNCSMCETLHIYYYELKEFCSAEVLPLDCLETGLEIGYLGPKEKVKKAVQNQDKAFLDLVEDLGFEDFFNNPDIMYQVLEYLNCLSEEGLMRCSCGNSHIDLEIFPDRLELGCSSCGAKALVFAETKEDFLGLKQFTRIELNEQCFVIKGIEKTKKCKKHSKK